MNNRTWFVMILYVALSVGCWGYHHHHDDHRGDRHADNYHHR